SCATRISLICKSKTLFESASCGRHCDRIINRAPVAVALRATRAFRTAKRLQIFFHDLGVLDHGDAATLGHFALQRDRFAAVISQLVADRLAFRWGQTRMAPPWR